MLPDAGCWVSGSAQGAQGDPGSPGVSVGVNRGRRGPAGLGEGLGWGLGLGYGVLGGVSQRLGAVRLPACGAPEHPVRRDRETPAIAALRAVGANPCPRVGGQVRVPGGGCGGPPAASQDPHPASGSSCVSIVVFSLIDAI